MDESDLILMIDERLKELEKVFVNGVPDWETYLRILNQYRGLEESKILIHDAYRRLNYGDSIGADEDRTD